MFEKMLDLVKNEVAGVVGRIGSIPQGKQGAVVDTAAGSLMNGLKQYANPAALGSLLGIGGAVGGSRGGSGGGSGMTGGLASGLISDLTSKVGLSPSVAKSVAAGVIPAVMSLFKKSVNDPSQPGFNLQSLVGALSGASSGSGGGLSGLLGSLGNLFGKKS